MVEYNIRSSTKLVSIYSYCCPSLCLLIFEYVLLYIGIVEEDEEDSVEDKVPDSSEPEKEEGGRSETDFSISDAFKRIGRGTVGSVSKAIKSVSDTLRRKGYV